MRYSIYSNFKNLSSNWGKYVFHGEKWNFEPIGNFAHTTKFLTIRKPLLILLLLYLQMLIIMLIMQISTQIDNCKYRKSVETKKSMLFQTMDLKFWNTKFNILCNIAFIFYEMSTHFDFHPVLSHLYWYS